MKWISASGLIALLVALTCSCGAKKEEAKVDVKAMVDQKCSICHPVDRIQNKPRSQRDWEVVMKRMRIINPQLLNQEETLLMTKYFKENLSK